MIMKPSWKTLFPVYPMLLGHRGCSALAPENTMPAFSEILKNGIPGAELDVYQCRSGELVVTHDSNLKRITGLDALVTDLDYSEIRKLDAGAWFSEAYSGEKIPLLDDVLDLLGHKAVIDIEVKHFEKSCAGLERELVSTIKKRKLQNSVMVSSFNPWVLRAVKKEHPDIFTAHIYTEYKLFPPWLSDGSGKYICNPDFLKPNRYRIHQNLVKLEQDFNNIPLITWTEDDPDVVRDFLDLGISGVITNRPEVMLPMFKDRWEHDG